MNEKLSLSLTIALLIVGGILFVASLLFSRPYPELEQPLWQGYYTLLIQGDFPVDGEEEFFSKAGITGAVSKGTQIVEFSDFITLSTVYLQDIDDRFEVFDPRLDPYIKGISRYFKGQLNGLECSVIYIPESNDPALFLPELNNLLPRETNIALVEQNKGVFWPYLIFFILYIGLCLLWKGDHHIVIILTAIPWLPFILASKLLAFGFALVTHLVFINLYEHLSAFFDQRFYYSWKEMDKKKIIVFSFYIIGVILIGLVILGITGDPLWSMLNFFLLFLGKSGAVILIKVSSILINRRRYHRLFIPIGVSNEQKIILKSSNRFLFIPVIGIILLLPLLGMLFSSPAYEADIPTPLALEGIHTFSFTDLRLLWEQNGTDLPDIADYIAHKAYQEAYFYGAGYGFPEETGVAISEYHPDENGSGKVSRFLKKVADFSSAWLGSIIPGEPVDGIAALLLDQNRPVGVEYQTLNNRSEHPVVYLIHVLFCCIMLAPLAFWNFCLTSRVLYGMTNSR